MTDDKMRRTPFMNQLLLIIMGAMLVFLVVSFARQIATSQQQATELKRVEEKIRISAAEKAQLEEYLDWVGSSEALELWARQHGWTRPGERLVVPVGVGAEASPPEQESLAEEEKASAPQRAWWDLFYMSQ